MPTRVQWLTGTPMVRAIVLWVAVVFLFFPDLAHAGRNVRMGIYENRPGVFTTAEGKVKGFYIDLFEAVASKEGWQIEYVPGTWSDGLARLETGEIHLLSAIAHTLERSVKYSFTRETLFSNWGQVYVRNPEIQSILHLEGRKIAGMEGDIYAMQFGNMMDSFNIPHQWVEATEYRDVLQLVEKGVVDAGVISRSNGIAIEQDYNVLRSAIVCCPMEIRYAAWKGKNQELLDALDRHVLQWKMNKNSVYYRSMERWFGGAVKKELPAWLPWMLIITTMIALSLTAGVIFLRRQRHLIQEKLEASYGERRAMEVKMLATSKLATIGEVATGVAHELNQPLTYISTFTQNLEVALQSGAVDIERLKKRIGTVNEQFRRIDEIIRHMQTFGRKDDSVAANNAQTIQLSEVVEKTLLLLGERIRLRNIHLEKIFNPDLPPIAGNMTRLEQIFINFFQNAIYALSGQEAPVITITISHLPAQKKVQVQFSDNGSGIEPDVRKKIFEPFFTTKGIGEGTGLGLSIVYGIVQEHGGSITCLSEPGIGTTFAIVFPQKGE
jgi:signal transduction histidine kinase